MPALNAADYAEFNRMLEELAPEVKAMRDTPRNFMTDMIDKNGQYGERVFVSVKQFGWIKQLHEEYVGDTDHATAGNDPRSNSDMDDDIPF